MKDILSISNQGLLDLAIEQLGSVDCVFELALKNGLSITSDLYAGQLLTLPNVLSTNSGISNYFINKKVATYTSFPNNGELTPIQEGIGYMAIEQDFNVH